MTVTTAALAWGAALSAWMSVIVLASLRHDPRIWQDDAPAPIQALLGPIPAASKRRRFAWGVVMVAGLVAIAAGLMASLPNTTTIPDRLLAAFVAFELFNLWDALALDVGVLLIWAPDWAFAPGTKHHPALREWSYHLRNFAVGVLAGLPFAGVVVGVWAGLRVML